MSALPKNSEELDQYLLELPDRELIGLVNVAEAERCKTDLHYLATEILGYKDLGAIHRPLCALVQSANARLAPIFSSINTPKKIIRYDVEAEHARNLAEWETKQTGLPVVKVTTLSTITPVTTEGNKALSDSSPTDETIRGVGGGGESEGTPPQNSTTFSNYNIDSINRLDKVAQSVGEFVSWHPDAQTRLWLMFRGSFKTTIISIAHTIQLMLLYPDIRILIASHKKEGGSQEILGAIKRHFVGDV